MHHPASILLLVERVFSREALRVLFQFGSNFNLVGEAETLTAALERLSQAIPDVVLIDFRLPICVLDAARRILARAPSAHVVVLSDFAEDPQVAGVVAAELRQVGVSAFLPKNLPAKELVLAIQRVLGGDPVFPRGAEAPPRAASVDIGDRAGVVPALTVRQRQVLKLVAEGLGNKEIAVRLRISPKTVEKHRQSVKEKLHTHNAADLARRAIGLGLVQPF